MTDDDMPEGWEDVARAGWNDNMAARAAYLGKHAYDAYNDTIHAWKVSVAQRMSAAIDVPVEMLVGHVLPVWDDLVPEIQNAWIRAALAVRRFDA